MLFVARKQTSHEWCDPAAASWPDYDYDYGYGLCCAVTRYTSPNQHTAGKIDFECIKAMHLGHTTCLLWNKKASLQGDRQIPGQFRI
jgi:hypothetical protein